MLRLGVLKLVSIVMLTYSLAIDTNGLPIHDPWFDISIGLWVFSAITGGMPEPEERQPGQPVTIRNSFGYIWLYRTFHLLSATGTAYFIHPKKWSDISGEEPPKK